MTYIEIVELRSNFDNPKHLEVKLTKFVDELNFKQDSCFVRLYRHAIVVTDWSFHLHYKSEIKVDKPSTLGFIIAAGLQEFGLVHHSLWSEEIK